MYNFIFQNKDLTHQESWKILLNITPNKNLVCTLV
jgi:hypothetical protein